MTWIHGFALPDIPADAVELLRFLLSSPETTESALEDWLRQYPQVINARRDDLHPKTRFPLPSGGFWEPDILAKELNSPYYEVVELKKATMPLVRSRDGPGMSYWRPSAPPRRSSELSAALAQLNLYLIYSAEFREYLDRAHNLRILYPRGTLIAGSASPDEHRQLRLIQAELPNDRRLWTWTGVLLRAEQMAQHRVLMSFPSVPEWRMNESERDFLAGLNRDVARRCFTWTGLGSPLFEPLREWKSALDSAFDQNSGSDEVDTDTDEGWNRYSRERGKILEKLYYRFGKYAYDNFRTALRGWT